MPGPRTILGSLGVARFCCSQPMLRLLYRGEGQPASRAVFMRRTHRAVVVVFGSEHALLDLAEEALDAAGAAGAEYALCALGAVCLVFVVLAVYTGALQTRNDRRCGLAARVLDRVPRFQ